MKYEKKFILNTAKYISENNLNSKKFLNEYYKNFRDIKKKIRIAYRLWMFNDSMILSSIYNQPIEVYTSHFLSYFGSVKNVKSMFYTLDLINYKQLFYIITKDTGDFFNIYEVFDNMSENDFSDEEIDYVYDILDEYKQENEHVKLDIEKYTFSLTESTNIQSSAKFLIIHEDLVFLLKKEISSSIFYRFEDGFFSVECTEKNIWLLRKSKYIKNLYQNKRFVKKEGIDFLKIYPEYIKVLKEIEQENRIYNMFTKHTEQENTDIDIPLKPISNKIGFKQKEIPVEESDTEI